VASVPLRWSVVYTWMIAKAKTGRGRGWERVGVGEKDSRRRRKGEEEQQQQH